MISTMLLKLSSRLVIDLPHSPVVETFWHNQEEDQQRESWWYLHHQHIRADATNSPMHQNRTSLQQQTVLYTPIQQWTPYAHRWQGDTCYIQLGSPCCNKLPIVTWTLRPLGTYFLMNSMLITASSSTRLSSLDRQQQCIFASSTTTIVKEAHNI